MASVNSAATPVAMTLLRTWIDNNRAIKDPAAPRTTSSLALGNLNEQTARELSNLIISALLSDSPERTSVVFGRRSIDGPSSWYPGMSYGMIQQLKPILARHRKTCAGSNARPAFEDRRSREIL
jgi:hypothetical protein